MINGFDILESYFVDWSKISRLIGLYKNGRLFPLLKDRIEKDGSKRGFI